MQPDQSFQPAYSAPVPEKKSPNVLGIVMTLATLLFLCTSAGLGYYAYTLNTDLNTRTAELNSLQAEHDTLKQEYANLQGNNAQLTSDLGASQAELEAVKQELATTQTDLKAAQDQTAALQAKIDDALLRTKVLISLWIEDKTDKGIEADIRETGDTEMLDMWQDYVSSNYNFDEFDRWFSHVLESIVAALD